MPTTWIPSAEAFGTPTLDIVLGAIGIPSAEAFGTATITHSSVILVQPTGIPSAEAFGSALTTISIEPLGLPSQEAFGTPTFNTTTTAMLCSATVYGSGVLSIGQHLSSGTVYGLGALSGTPIHIINLDPVIYGSGTLTWSGPGLIQGYGTIVGYLAFARVPPPICQPICGCDSCCGRREETCEECFQWHRRHFHCEAWWWQCRDCWRRHAEHRRGFDFDHGHEGPHEHEWTKDPTRPMGQFRWNQTFGKGDLEICLRDRWGNQRGPVFIGYTMYVVTSTGVLHQVGPTDRKPAKADVGKFYVTGTAGENGQPGCWAVKWRYQRTYSEPMIEQVQQFRVLDAVLDCDRPDPVRRHCKYGWDL